MNCVGKIYGNVYGINWLILVKLKFIGTLRLVTFIYYIYCLFINLTVINQVFLQYNLNLQIQLICLQ
jgi:hypothetical protein